MMDSACFTLSLTYCRQGGQFQNLSENNFAEKLELKKMEQKNQETP